MFLSFFESLQFALGITAPIFLLVILGISLRRLGWIDEAFINKASSLVFSVGLPTVLFINIVQAPLAQLVSFKLIGVGLSGTLLVFFLFWLVAPMFVNHKKEVGVFVQGGYRGNMGIIGLAFCLSAYGDDGVVTISIYMAILTILYNILAVFILTKTLSDSFDQQALTKAIFRNIVKNPLIIAICLALLLSAVNAQLPYTLMQTGAYISDMTLPLALLCIGGSISLKELRASSGVSLAASMSKLIVAPAIILAIAMPFNFAPMELGVLFLMSAAPTATASYIMVQAMNGNGTLAANIVVLTTLLSIVTVSTGIVLLRSASLI
ncbi:AEC family transporter [Aurantivibrio plasticivorans]